MRQISGEADQDADARNWETDSTVSTATTEHLIASNDLSHYSNTVKAIDQAAPPIASFPAFRHPALQAYWTERARFIKHLEKRNKKFVKRSREDYDAARWGKQKSKPAKRKPAPVKASSATPAPAPTTPTPVAPPISPTSSSDSDMIASTSKAVARTARVARPAAASFSTSAPAFKGAKKQKDPLAMDSLEATRVLRALEIYKPNASYRLTLQLKLGKNNKPPSIRGRVTLPRDSRRSRDIILVFAEPGSESARLATEAGVEHVGSSELIDALLAEEIHPTKVLTTPGMLPAVTGRLARFLGPKGLMPTVRRGGVGEGQELVERIKDARGAMDWKTDDLGRIRSPVGRVGFAITDIDANIKVLVKSVRDSMTTPTNSLDEHLISNRTAAVKQSAGITAAYLESSEGPRITLKDI